MNGPYFYRASLRICLGWGVFAYKTSSVFFLFLNNFFSNKIKICIIIWICFLNNYFDNLKFFFINGKTYMGLFILTFCFWLTSISWNSLVNKFDKREFKFHFYKMWKKQSTAQHSNYGSYQYIICKVYFQYICIIGFKLSVEHFKIQVAF